MAFGQLRWKGDSSPQQEPAGVQEGPIRMSEAIRQNPPAYQFRRETGGGIRILEKGGKSLIFDRTDRGIPKTSQNTVDFVRIACGQNFTIPCETV